MTIYDFFCYCSLTINAIQIIFIIAVICIAFFSKQEYVIMYNGKILLYGFNSYNEAISYINDRFGEKNLKYFVIVPLLDAEIIQESENMKTCYHNIYTVLESKN